MIRKTIIALAAVAAVASVAATPTTASAGWKGGGFGGKPHFHFGFKAFHRPYFVDYCTYKKVWNKWTYSWELIKVC